MMLSALLKSLSAIRIEDEWDVTFLIVENDTSDHCRDLTLGFKPKFHNANLQYVLEPRLGIPIARNRAAKEAIAAEADLLLFIDDDEEVPVDWLSRMIAGYRNSKALLFGAPVRSQPPAENLSAYQRLLYTNVSNRYRRKERRAEARATLNGTNGVTIVTSNWMAHTSLFRNYGIWFDETMQFSGGSDTKFFSDVVNANIPTGWIKHAIVYETIPTTRLSVSYQFRRARDQSNNHARKKYYNRNSSTMSILASIVAKSLILVILLISVIPSGGTTLLTTTRTAGWIAGRMAFLLGRKSKLYQHVTGD